MPHILPRGQRAPSAYNAALDCSPSSELDVCYLFLPGRRMLPSPLGNSASIFFPSLLDHIGKVEPNPLPAPSMKRDKQYRLGKSEGPLHLTTVTDRRQGLRLAVGSLLFCTDVLNSKPQASC